MFLPSITQIENELNDVLVWSTSAPISNSLKLELQNAINAIKNQLDTTPFSCCNTIKALEAFQFALVQMIDQPLVGIPVKVHLQNLTQQLQARFSDYKACLACGPGPTRPTKATAYVTNFRNDTVSIVDLTTNTIIPPTMTGFPPTGIAIK
ncbi:hypothetical protein NLU03_20095 [Bacillus toyonensis]|nr:hypothetical protein [Bacillus toyonensis]